MEAGCGMRQNGEANSQARLRERDVRAIRLLWTERIYTPTELAAMYSVSRATIQKIVAGKLWPNVK